MLYKNLKDCHQLSKYQQGITLRLYKTVLVVHLDQCLPFMSVSEAIALEPKCRIIYP